MADYCRRARDVFPAAFRPSFIAKGVRKSLPLAKLPYCRPRKICLPVRKCAIIVAIRRADVIFLPRFYAKEFENYVNPVPIRAVEFRVEAALHRISI